MEDLTADAESTALTRFTQANPGQSSEIDRMGTVPDDMETCSITIGGRGSHLSSGRVGRMVCKSDESTLR